MNHAEFTEIQEEERPTFLAGRTYQMLSPKLYTSEELSRDGASDMVVLVKDEDETLFTVSAAFMAGCGGEDGMEEMQLRVNSICRLGVSANGGITQDTMALAKQMMITAAPGNILLVDTILAQSSEASNERAERFIKRAADKII